MKTTLPAVRPRMAPPVDLDQETWARRFILSPAQNDRDRRDRWIVAHLLADLEAQR